jgi:hypothetical protein
MTETEGSGMATLKIKDLRTITIKILPNKKRVQLRFETIHDKLYESIEVELASILALGLANETLKLLSPRDTQASPARAPSGVGRKLAS